MLSGLYISTGVGVTLALSSSASSTLRNVLLNVEKRKSMTHQKINMRAKPMTDNKLTLKRTQIEAVAVVGMVESLGEV